MLAIFPTSYPDELLYSVLARYYIWSANVSPKVTLEELFGKTTVIATFDLPSNIENLVQNLPTAWKYTADSFIQENTLYPFYAPFLTKKAKIVYQSMCKHVSGDIHSRIGIMASSIPIPQYFKFCSICNREDYEKHGEIYWRRLHQTFGVLVCPTHKVWLQKSSVKIKGDNRHEFIAADVENCVFRLKVVDYTKKDVNKLVVLADDIDLLLKSSFLSKTGKWFRSRYQSLLIDKGLATASGRVHQKDLLREFDDYYGKKFLKLVHSEIDLDNEGNWLTSIVRKHRKVFHPLRHLLLIRFLEKDLSSFFKQRINQSPFGKGPWTCFNGASEHYLKKVITSVFDSYSNDMKKLVGTFTCSCGFIYSTSDKDIPHSNNMSYGKIKSYGNLWENKLKELFANKSLSLREIGRQLKVDTKTVISHAKRLHLINDNSLPTVKKQVKVEKVNLQQKEQREKWLKIQKEFPNFSKTELRQKHPAIYIWLYRNDREWFDENSPKKHKIPTINNRVNWQQRDQKILKLSQHCVNELFEQERPVRITISRIGKEIGHSSLIEKHLNKLPKTKEFYENVFETIEQFQIRRISWAVEKLSVEKDSIKVWQVVRLAGLKKETAQKLKTHIEWEITKVIQQTRRRMVM